MKRDAHSEGVSEGVLEWALEDLTVSKDSVVKRKTMPEVKLILDDYLKRSACTPFFLSKINVQGVILVLVSVLCF